MIAVYPGTFDPITNGHIDILIRASRIFDKVILAVADDSGKQTMFSINERMKLCTDATSNMEIEVRGFSGLLVDFMHEIDSKIIVRGVRAISDFEYEFQMSCMNARLASDIETVFLPASEDKHFVSSRTIKTVSRLGGDVSQFVPNCVLQEFQK